MIEIHNYIYFVHYTFVAGLNSGKGRCEIALPNKITKISTLKEIEEGMAQIDNHDSVAIDNFILLRENSKLDI